MNELESKWSLIEWKDAFSSSMRWDSFRFRHVLLQHSDSYCLIARAQPSLNLIATAETSGHGSQWVGLYTYDTQKLVHKLDADEEKFEQYIRGLVFDGSNLVVGSSDSHLKVWDINTHQLKLDWESEHRDIYSVDCVNDNFMLCTNSGHLVVGDLRAPQSSVAHEIHSAGIYSFQRDINENMLVTTGKDKTAKRFDVRKLGVGQEIATVTYEHSCRNVFFDNRYVSIVTFGDFVFVYKVSDFMGSDPQHMWKDHASDTIHCTKFNSHILMHNELGTLVFRDLVTGNVLHKDKYHLNHLYYIDLHSDCFVTTGMEGKTVLWELGGEDDPVP